MVLKPRRWYQINQILWLRQITSFSRVPVFHYDNERDVPSKSSGLLILTACGLLASRLASFREIWEVKAYLRRSHEASARHCLGCDSATGNYGSSNRSMHVLVDYLDVLVCFRIAVMLCVYGHGLARWVGFYSLILLADALSRLWPYAFWLSPQLWHLLRYQRADIDRRGNPTPTI